MHGGERCERSERAGEAVPTPRWTDERRRRAFWASRGSEEGSEVVKGPPMHGGERGQASVELALCLPVVAVLLLVVVQAGLVVADQVAVVQAAREGARRAAVDPDPAAARHAALGGRLVPGQTTVSVERLGGRPPLARVTVRHRAATEVPLVGGLLPDVELASAATMAVEGR